MKEKFLLIINQTDHTTSALLLDKFGSIRDSHSENVRPLHTGSDRTEYDALELIYNVRSCIHKVMQGFTVSESSSIAGIGIVNEAHTCVIWDGETGLPISNAIGSSCVSTIPIFKKITCPNLKAEIKERTGMSLNYEAIPLKVQHRLQNDPMISQSVAKGHAMVGTLDSWILFNLTGRQVFATDVTNAAGSYLYNIYNKNWDPFLLREFQIENFLLPKVKPSIGVFGKTKSFIPVPDGIPVVAMLSSSQAIFEGLHVNSFGDSLLSLDNNGNMLVYTGQTPINSKHFDTILLSKDNTPHYGISAHVAFPTKIKWGGADDLMQPSKELEDKISKLKPNNIYILPLDFTGTFHSLWGITPQSTREDMIRAFYETITYKTRNLINEVNQDMEFTIKNVKVVGSFSKINFLMQFMADILQLPLGRIATLEQTALGVGKAVSDGIGFFGKLVDGAPGYQIERTFIPTMDPISSKELFNEWFEYTSLVRNYYTPRYDH